MGENLPSHCSWSKTQGKLGSSSGISKLAKAIILYFWFLGKKISIFRWGCNRPDGYSGQGLIPAYYRGHLLGIMNTPRFQAILVPDFPVPFLLSPVATSSFLHLWHWQVHSFQGHRWKSMTSHSSDNKLISQGVQKECESISKHPEEGWDEGSDSSFVLNAGLGRHSGIQVHPTCGLSIPFTEMEAYILSHLINLGEAFNFHLSPQAPWWIARTRLGKPLEERCQYKSTVLTIPHHFCGLCCKQELPSLQNGCISMGLKSTGWWLQFPSISSQGGGGGETL